jgi:dipeptidyl aminopeptidase/acylaminoacyl peptidase
MVVSGSKFSPSGVLIEENDTNAIYLYDHKTKTFGDKLYQDPNYDVSGLTGSCRQASGGASNDRMSGEISSISYDSLQPEKIFFNKQSEEAYLTVKSVFPDHNVSIVSSSSDRKKMVARIWGTHEPGEYFLVDLTKGSVQSLFKTRPWLDRSKLSKAKEVRYTARDGLEIPALLTLTKVKTDKNYFMIMPHGGPNTKQYIGYDSWVQFFTSRGVNILQPDFRGSTGLGTNHYVLGNQEWGKSMQDDISDGVAWAIENGYADEDRVCIVGASYGGYATMAGLTFTPDLYRCGINAIGVTDQIQILENFANRASIRQSWDEEPLLEWGDISTEEGKAYALSSSPVNFVKNIQAPVLVLQGSNDRTVEPRHAEDLIDKLKSLNKEYMAMFQAKAGHCVTGCQERAALEYLEIQEEFIDKYLKN